MKNQKRSWPMVLGVIGAVVLVLLVFSALMPVHIICLPFEVLGEGLVWFSVGYAAPFSRRWMAVVLLIWLAASLFDPLIWQFTPAFSGGAKGGWGLSVLVNSIAGVVTLIAFFLGSVLNRRSGQESS